MIRSTAGAALAAAFALAGAAFDAGAAQSPAALSAGWEAAARAAAPGFTGFSAARGRTLYETASGDWSCATCHTADPRAPGKHAKTGKAIAPLSPAANPERFTDSAFTEKWFRRNCNDVLGRTCTPQEKGDLLAWLLEPLAGRPR